MKTEVIGYDRASLLDLAMLAGGSLDCLMEFASANALSITDDVEPGRQYETRCLTRIDTGALKRLSEDNVRPATGLSAEDIAACPYGGIGYMGIETDFEVS